MNFFISKIKLWFRNGTMPCTYEFFQDKVNVITGASSTGKSSILKIIDYCLLQNRCNIVQDVINESVSWYGLLFYVDGKPYTVIRKAPTVEHAEMVVIFRKEVYLPDDDPIIKDGDTRPKALVSLNKLLGIPTKLRLESKVKLNFRHFLLFNYLTEDIIATESTYQDLRFFRDREYDKVLDDLFKLVIGVNEKKRRDLETELEEAKVKYSKIVERQKKEGSDAEAYVTKKKNFVQELAKLNLCDPQDVGGDPESWLRVLTSVIEDYKVQFKSVSDDNKRKKLESEIAQRKETLGYYISLEKEYSVYKKRLSRNKDCLQPIEFIEAHMGDVFNYYETGILMNKLKNAWLSLKKEYTPEVTLPSDFNKRKNQLNDEISKLQLELDRLNPMVSTQSSVQWLRKVILLAERVDKELKKEPQITIKEEDIIRGENEVIALEEKLKRLDARSENAIGDLNTCIGEYFISQKGMSDSYKDCMPTYSTAEHSIMLDRKGWEYPISNVGSKSNYMFLHLCYFLGLHDLILTKENPLVLPFLFIDQPSIPYYADRFNDSVIEDEDKGKLTEAFKLIQRFMQMVSSKGKHFQIILIEHAGPDYWKNMKSFKTIKVFTKHQGLIPEGSIKK